MPYVVLWRVLTLFLCMFVGGLYVFRYLGTDVLEASVKQTEAEKRALAEAARGASESPPLREEETADRQRGMG